MKKITIAVMAIALFGVGVYSYLKINEKSTDAETQQPWASNLQTYSNSELGLEFRYPTGPNGYVLEEKTPASNKANLLKTITLLRSEDAKRLQANPSEAGEGPAVIAISVFTNGNKQFPLQWARQHTDYSTYTLKIGEDIEGVIGGANALGYAADGLYRSDNFVVAHGNLMYMFTGQFENTNSPIRKDFKTLTESVKFIPTNTGTSAKINIDIVCQDALSYMSFPDGAAADAFVKECKEGKRPEVIEKYKKDNGLGDGAAI